MTFCLKTTIIRPEKDVSIKNAVILLHGYGGDGRDISMLTLNWKRFLPDTIFLCPNGHEKCVINPTGYQWFDLTRNDPEYVIEQSKKAERRIWSIEIVESMVALKIDKDASNAVSELTNNNGEDDSAIDFRYYDDNKSTSYFLSLAGKFKILKNIPFMLSLYLFLNNFLLIMKFKAKKFFIND